MYKGREGLWEMRVHDFWGKYGAEIMFFETSPLPPPPPPPLGEGGRGLLIRGKGCGSSDFKIENSCMQDFSGKAKQKTTREK
jgi:hypothetical protein